MSRRGYIKKPEVSHSKQVWKNVGGIVGYTVISVILFGVFYWVVDFEYMNYHWKMVIGFCWIAATIYCVRKYACIVENEKARSLFVYLPLCVSIAGGLLGVRDYIHRFSTPVHHVECITKENIGDAEYIESERGVEVLDNCAGSDTWSMSTSKGFDTYYSTAVVVPVKDSHGVYLCYVVRGPSYKRHFKSNDKREKEYEESMAVMRDEIHNHDYDPECRSFYRIFRYNDEHYDHYLKAMDQSFYWLNDSDYCVERMPILLQPAKDLNAGHSAHPNIIYLIMFLFPLIISCSGIVVLVLEE